MEQIKLNEEFIKFFYEKYYQSMVKVENDWFNNKKDELKFKNVEDASKKATTEKENINQNHFFIRITNTSYTSMVPFFSREKNQEVKTVEKDEEKRQKAVNTISGIDKKYNEDTLKIMEEVAELSINDDIIIGDFIKDYRSNYKNELDNIDIDKDYIKFIYRNLIVKSVCNENSNEYYCKLLPIYKFEKMKFRYELLYGKSLNQEVGKQLEDYINVGHEIMNRLYAWCKINVVTPGTYYALYQMIWDIGEIVQELNDASPNVIYYGAPGTGKNYYVEKMVSVLTCNNPKRAVFVQCHPGFGYDEFMEGIKPVGMNDGKLQLDVVNGSFKELCIRANDDDEKKNYYYVADEINRANLSEMFGETLSLLEADYRCEKGNKFDSNTITTPSCKVIATIAEGMIQKGDTEGAKNYLKSHAVKYEIDGDKVKVGFGIPKNIRFIGMMNDVDRSIDAFDLALRRRFKWISKDCDLDVIRNTLGGKYKNIDEYKKKCKELNDYISESDNDGLGLGKSYEFGHSYFLRIKDICNGDENINDDHRKKLFNEYLRPVLVEYVRTQKDEKDVYEAVDKAGQKFVNADYKYESKNELSLKEVFNTTKNVILYGCPGTGKTYQVKKFFENFEHDAEENGRVTWVQCHPGFGYEEFMEGIKPSGISNGNVQLDIVNGAFKDLCIRANKDYDHRYYYVADEINRANLSSMFGETLSLLEEDKRYKNLSGRVNPSSSKAEKDADLQRLRKTPLSGLISVYLKNNPGDEDELAFYYEDGNVKFGIPENVYFIGMMNDVDRSIDTFDLALRRRFTWIRVEYNEDTLKEYLNGKFDKWDKYATNCTKLNNKIKEDLGQSYEFGHAVYMKIVDYLEEKELKKEAREKFFDEHIAPTLKEYYRSILDNDKEIQQTVSDCKRVFSPNKKN